MNSGLMMMVLMIAVMGFMMWNMSRQQKKARTQREQWLSTLRVGERVLTAGGILGTLEEVDHLRQEVVVNSEGSKFRIQMDRITMAPIEPAFVSDDEVDEYGNPLPPQQAPNQAMQQTGAPAAPLAQADPSAPPTASQAQPVQTTAEPVPAQPMQQEAQVQTQVQETATAVEAQAPQTAAAPTDVESHDQTAA